MSDATSIFERSSSREKALQHFEEELISLNLKYHIKYSGCSLPAVTCFLNTANDEFIDIGHGKGLGMKLLAITCNTMSLDGGSMYGHIPKPLWEKLDSCRCPQSDPTCLPLSFFTNRGWSQYFI